MKTFLLIIQIVLALGAKPDAASGVLKALSDISGPRCPTGQALWPMFVANNTLHVKCVLARLKADSKDKVANLAAAEIFRHHGYLEEEAVALKAARGGPSKFVTHWWYLGPFPIGKHEIDGDPAANSMQHPSIDTLLYSEVSCCAQSDLKLVGQVSWSMLQATTTDAIIVAPKVRCF